MIQSLDQEYHFTASDFIRDIIIGMSDGLTVPFALAAGLSGAVHSTGIIITAGLAEIAAGSISMGLGGYLAAKSDKEHYNSERVREEFEVGVKPEAEANEVMEILKNWGLTTGEATPVAQALRKRPEAWVDFMMRFELGLEKPDPKRALHSALTIAGSYLVAGFIPLSPYIFISAAKTGLIVSAVITLIALATFGYLKGFFTGTNPLRSSVQTALIGGMAATAAFFIARMVSGIG